MTSKFTPRTTPLFNRVVYVGEELWDSVHFTNELETGEELSGTPTFTPESSAIMVNVGTPALDTYQQTNDTAKAIMTAVAAGRTKVWVECDTTNNQHVKRYIEWNVKATT